MTTSATRYRAPGFGASVMLSALHSPLVHGLRHNLCELRYQARRSGRPIALPVSCARMDHKVIVRVGRGGLLMAAAMAAVTGYFLVRILRTTA